MRLALLALAVFLLTACGSALAASQRQLLPFVGQAGGPTATNTPLPTPTPVALPFAFTAATSEDPDHPGSDAIDGNSLTYWLPAADDTAPELVVAFDPSTSYEVGAVRVDTVGGAGQLRVVAFTHTNIDGVECFTAPVREGIDTLLGSCGPFPNVYGLRLDGYPADPSDRMGIRSATAYQTSRATTPIPSTTPVKTPTVTPTPTVSPTVTTTPTVTLTATRTPSPTRTTTPTATPTPSPTLTPTVTVTPTTTTTPTPTQTPTPYPPAIGTFVAELTATAGPPLTQTAIAHAIETGVAATQTATWTPPTATATATPTPTP